MSSNTYIPHSSYLFRIVEVTERLLRQQKGYRDRTLRRMLYDSGSSVTCTGDLNLLHDAQERKFSALVANDNTMTFTEIGTLKMILKNSTTGKNVLCEITGLRYSPELHPSVIILSEFDLRTQSIGIGVLETQAPYLRGEQGQRYVMRRDDSGKLTFVVGNVLPAGTQIKQPAANANTVDQRDEEELSWQHIPETLCALDTRGQEHVFSHATEEWLESVNTVKTHKRPSRDARSWHAFHMAMGHCGYDKLEQLRAAGALGTEKLSKLPPAGTDYLRKKEQLGELPKQAELDEVVSTSLQCAICPHANAVFKSVPRQRVSTYVLPIYYCIHLDLIAQIKPVGRWGHKHMALFTDQTSVMRHGYLMTMKDDFPFVSRQFLADVERAFMNSKGEICVPTVRWIGVKAWTISPKVYRLKADRDSVFMTFDSRELMRRNGIRLTTRPGHSSAQFNAIAERSIRTVVTKARAMLLWSQLPPDMWAHALLHAVDVTNHTPTKALQHSPYGQVPISQLTHEPKVDMRRFYPFGCLGYLKKRKEAQTGKFTPRAEPMIYLGRASDHIGYKLFNIVTERVIDNVHAQFHQDYPAGILYRQMYPNRYPTGADGKRLMPFYQQFNSDKLDHTLLNPNDFTVADESVDGFEAGLREDLAIAPWAGGLDNVWSPAQGYANKALTAEQAHAKRQKYAEKKELDSKKRVREPDTDTACSSTDGRLTAISEVKTAELEGQTAVLKQKEQNSVETEQPRKKHCAECEQRERAGVQATQRGKVAVEEVTVNDLRPSTRSEHHFAERVQFLAGRCDHPAMHECYSGIDPDGEVKSIQAHHMITDNHPRTLMQALNHPIHADMYRAAAAKEFQNFDDMDALDWNTPRDIEPGNVVSSLVNFVFKRNEHNQIIKCKCRVCCRGDTQRAGIDVDLTASPVGDDNIGRLLIALVAMFNWLCVSADAVGAFLQSTPRHDVYMRLPAGADLILGEKARRTDGRMRILKLKKAVYGLRDSSRAFYEHLSSVLVQTYSFKQCSVDPCLYIHPESLILHTHVDDFKMISRNAKRQEIDAFGEDLNKRIEITLENRSITYHLGLCYEHTTEGITMSLEPMIDRMAERWQSKKSPVSLITTGDAHTLADKLDAEGNRVSRQRLIPAHRPEHKNYCKLVGEILYVAMKARPDIANVARELGRLFVNPTFEAWSAARHVLRYLRHTKHYKMHFPRKTNGDYPVLSFAVDASYANNSDARSTTGYVGYINGVAFMWGSKTQPMVADSSTQAELIALSDVVRKVVIMRRVLADLCFPQKERTVVTQDNEGVIKSIRDPINAYTKQRHLDRRHMTAFEAVHGKDHQSREQGEMQLKAVGTKQMLADLLTKNIKPAADLQRLCKLNGLIEFDYIQKE